jgi:hypothetical protein
VDKKFDISLHCLHPRGSLLYINQPIRYSKDAFIIILLNNISLSQLDETFSKFSLQNTMSNTSWTIFSPHKYIHNNTLVNSMKIH